MMRSVFGTGCLLSLVLPCGQVMAQPALDGLVDRDIAALVGTYKALHAAPELSHYEEKTSAFLAKELRALGYTVTERLGKFSRPEWRGYGVVGVLRNGEGPVVLVRSDMDALPVEEKTGLPYASKVRTKNDAGQEVGVMHACGHDIHMTTLLGTAKLLAELRNEWRGTLVLVGQPAEETIDGAQAMLNDGLYDRIPKVDYALAIHDTGDLPAGKVGLNPGFIMASGTAVEITVRGIGGHGARPELAKDPVVLASQIVLALQTIVSRENSPIDPAVVTVGSIHGGTRPNIIPDEVKLQLTVRAYKDESRQKILEAIERIAKGTAAAAGIPPELAPVVVVSKTEFTPATYNDPALAERLSAVFKRTLGADNVGTLPPAMISEDFARFGLDGHQIPSVLYQVGATDPVKFAEGQRIGTPPPALHSALFAPVPEPTIRTGIKLMTASVLELMKKQ